MSAGEGWLAFILGILAILVFTAVGAVIYAKKRTGEKLAEVYRRYAGQ